MDRTCSANTREMFSRKSRVFKTEAGDAFPFVLRIEKEELQVQGNGFHLERGRNIQPIHSVLGLGRKHSPGFQALQGRRERH